MSIAWHEKTAHEIRDAVQAGKVSAEEVTRAFLARIEAVDAKVDAYTQVWGEAALAQAQALDQKAQAGSSPGRAGGRARCAQGSLLHKSGLHHLFLKNAGEFSKPL